MFIFHKETTLEDLGNGVTRRILAHGGNMMAVEVNFDAGAIGPMHNHPTNSSPMCSPANLSSPSVKRNAWSRRRYALQKAAYYARLRLPEAGHAA
jgi:hypothetical protein